MSQQDNLNKTIKKIPNSSGVYIFLDKNRKILYIGKATSLKNRVRSYFGKDISEKRSPLIAKMVREIKDVGYKKTDSVLEALILESKLIKKYAPKYNTAEKDQKSFNHIIITKEDFPKIILVRERNLNTLDQSIKYSFGPFPYGSELKEALKIIRKIFPFRDKCKLGQQKPCFNAQIGLCPGVCSGLISKKEYAKNIENIKNIFDGKKKIIIKNLEKEMKDLASIKEFEKAGRIKNKIFALNHIQDIALIKNKTFSEDNREDRKFRIEAYDIAHISGANMVGVMTVLENSEIKKSDYRMFKIRGQNTPDDTKALKEILERRFKHKEWSSPNIIVVDGGITQLNTASIAIINSGIRTKLVAVTKDERHRAKKIDSLSDKEEIINKYKKEIILANSEAHRFAIKFHRKIRDRIKT